MKLAYCAWLCLPLFASAQKLRLAYTNTHQAFVQNLKLAAERAGVTASIEFVDTVVLNETVMRRASANECPDAVIMSADNLARETLAFSPISRDLLSPALSERTLSLATINGEVRGIPVICGNHLMLYYNKSGAGKPITALEDSTPPTSDGHRSIVWNHAVMYYFWPFILAYEGSPLGTARLQMDHPNLARALEAYVATGRKLQLKTELDHNWSIEAFVGGRAQCLIDGDWNLGALEARLGADLGIAPLPSSEGRPLQAVCSAFVLAFPNLNLSHEKQEALKRLALALQSQEFQIAVWKEMRAIPASEEVLRLVMASDDELIKRSLLGFNAAQPMPMDPRMPIVWETLEKGYQRRTAGYYTTEAAADYMQSLADKSLSAARR